MGNLYKYSWIVLYEKYTFFVSIGNPRWLHFARLFLQRSSTKLTILCFGHLIAAFTKCKHSSCIRSSMCLLWQ